MIDRLRRTTPRTRAVLLSFLMPGLGQVYLGRLGRAAIWFLGLAGLGMAFARDGVAEWAPALFAFVLGVFSAADAAVVAPVDVPPSG